ncbi:branched-chain amino acid ABC transporter permease [Burkholderia sp. WAC0059]|uniref:branched-chain amino acid ABC transporter permease n=1 Tax=Burkholderia sp. WAC0059 TaxID=2066022 RepID=UPI000C7EFFD3|nr:branched-chain amino acid ABC transporter permease [Burkholderia sp. WAC0059]PLZ00132.1 branched-chain amino acid ABC transporter permease [Burkholderia sp. WAC0059]
MFSFLIDVLIRTADLMLVSVGVSTLYSLVRFPNIAHVQYAMLGAFATLAAQRAGMPFALAAAASCILIGVLAVLLNAFVFARLLRRGGATAMIGSLAVSMILVAVPLGIAGSSPLHYDFGVARPVMLWGTPISVAQIASIGCGALTLLLFAWLLFTTDLGRSTRALATNRELAMATGIDVARVTALITFISGVLAALGGTMLGLTEDVHTNLGNDLLLPVFAAAILGGLGNPLGAAAGALLIALAETLVTNIDFGFLFGRELVFFPIAYLGAASFAILLLALILRPYGLFDREVRRV